MSHPEQLGFFAAVAAVNKELVANCRVLEVGSYDVNGSIRSIFADAREYVGVDLQEGPGVDVVAFGHELTEPDDSFDLAVSGECFEHDPTWPQTLRNMWRMTRPGGLVVFTCASTGRPEHGTTRSDKFESPGTQSRGLDYYRNLTEADIRRELPLESMFDRYRLWYLPTSFDLYFVGVKRGEGSPRGVLPSDASVEALKDLMPWPHKAARAPLRGLVKVTTPDTYQRYALPYWRTLLFLQDKFAGGGFRRADHAPDRTAG